jgi:F-type H+-transporting ATPase subunit delta
MGAASREALANLRRHREATAGSDASSDTLIELARDLYAVAELLVAQPQLRRAMSDASTSPAWRAELLAGLLGGKVCAAAIEVSQHAVRERWSSPWDLTDALELAGDDTLFGAAEREGVLDDVEDQLFRFERILDAQSRLTTLLDEAIDPARRVGLLDAVVGAMLHPITRFLLEHAIVSQRKRSITFEVHDLLDEAGARHERSIARVLSAVDLTDAQQTRLATSLGEMYGRPVSVRTAVDPTVRGGLIVRVGDEIIDGSVAARLTGARAALAG